MSTNLMILRFWNDEIKSCKPAYDIAPMVGRACDRVSFLCALHVIFLVTRIIRMQEMDRYLFVVGAASDSNISICVDLNDFVRTWHTRGELNRFGSLVRLFSR